MTADAALEVFEQVLPETEASRMPSSVGNADSLLLPAACVSCCLSADTWDVHRFKLRGQLSSLVRADEGSMPRLPLMLVKVDVSMASTSTAQVAEAGQHGNIDSSLKCCQLCELVLSVPDEGTCMGISGMKRSAAEPPTNAQQAS